jgi:hypothetical protein
MGFIKRANFSIKGDLDKTEKEMIRKFIKEWLENFQM